MREITLAIGYPYTGFKVRSHSKHDERDTKRPGGKENVDDLNRLKVSRELYQ
jgi:hypothetical protein